MRKKSNKTKSNVTVLDVEPVEPVVDNTPIQKPPPTLSVENSSSGEGGKVFFPKVEPLPPEVASFDASETTLPFSTPPSWHAWFMQGVYWVASKSKDPMTKIGALLVKDNRIISSGYNGIPIGVNDVVQSRAERPEKYKWFEHAERNAIYSAARHGISTEGSILYTNALPCVDCARGIIQAGIKEVYVHKQFNALCREAKRDQWIGHEEVSYAMFNEGGVTVYDVDGSLKSKGYFNGKVYDV